MRIYHDEISMEVIQMTEEELFEGRCPYTDKPCYDWNCKECKVEKEEREWMERIARGEHDDN